MPLYAMEEKDLKEEMNGRGLSEGNWRDWELLGDPRVPKAGWRCPWKKKKLVFTLGLIQSYENSVEFPLKIQLSLYHKKKEVQKKEKNIVFLLLLMASSVLEPIITLHFSFIAFSLVLTG